MNGGRVIPSIEESQLALVLKEPYGVVAAIVPWNYPILLRKLGEEGLDEFREIKHVHGDFEGAVKPWWYPYGKK